MKTKVISFYEQFNCLKGDCPYTCCKGWRVPLDDKTWRRYQKVPGIKGFFLCLATKKHPAEGHLLRRVFDRCPYLNKQNLCYHQCKGHDDFMPEICKIYPRLSVGYGEYQEIMLELSCYRAAELFFKNQGRLSLQDTDLEYPVFREEENDDPEFLQFLLEDREYILDYLWKPEDTGWKEENDEAQYTYASLIQKMKIIYSYVYEENLHILSQNLSAAKKLQIEDENRDLADLGALTFQGRHAKKTFYPVSMLNKIIYQWFDGFARHMENPLFYKYIRKYRRYFGNILEKDADVYFEKRMQELLKQHPEFGKLFYSYYSYCLQETYLLAYSDYYLLRSVMLSSLYCQFLMLFFVVAFMRNEKKQPDPSAIIMMVEKAFRHNNSLEKLMLEKIRDLQ